MDCRTRRKQNSSAMCLLVVPKKAFASERIPVDRATEEMHGWTECPDLKRLRASPGWNGISHRERNGALRGVHEVVVLRNCFTPPTLSEARFIPTIPLRCSELQGFHLTCPCRPRAGWKPKNWTGQCLSASWVLRGQLPRLRNRPSEPRTSRSSTMFSLSGVSQAASVVESDLLKA